MTIYKKVAEDTSFVRDMHTNAIINIDNEALLNYKKRKRSTAKLQNDVDSLKNEMQEIKNLLVQLLDK